MKAVTYDKHSDVFTLREIAQPQSLLDNDVLVKVHAVGLNPVDAKVNLWNGMVEGMSEDFVGGLDVSGEIVKMGAAVEGWSIGDRVVYHGNMRRMSGGFAEYAIHDASTLLKHPNVSSEIAAATPCAAWTAYRALVDKLNVEAKDSIFIAGGAGGVGTFAIQMAKLLGVKTIIATASQKNHDYLASLGATHLIDYRNDDVISKVLEIVGESGVDASLDCVGGDNDILCASVLGYEGEMVELVKVVEPERYPDAFLKGLTFHQLSLGSGHVNGEKGIESIVQSGSKVNQWLENGSLQIPQLKVIDIDDVPEALQGIREQRTVGKIVAKLV